MSRLLYICVVGGGEWGGGLKNRELRLPTGRYDMGENRQPEPLNARLINVKPITTQEKFNFPRASANPSPRTAIALGT